MRRPYGSRFGVYLMQYCSPDIGDLFEDLTVQARTMDELGYECAMLGERHLRTEGFLELQAVMPALVSLTKRLRFCVGVLEYPLYDPFHVAEYTSTLDVISHGRLDFGVGVGASREVRTFGISTDDLGGRLDDAIRITKELWAGGHVTSGGKFFRYQDAFISPLPVQKPHPPLLVGAKTERALRRAARLGDGWIVAPNETREDARKKAELYRRTAGKEKRSSRIVVIREAYIAKTRETAIKVAKPAIRAIYDYYSRNDTKREGPDGDRRSFDFEEKVEDSTFVVGSPDDCIAAIERLRGGLSTDEFCLRFQLPGISQRQTLDAIRLWAEKVMPHFALEGH